MIGAARQTLADRRPVALRFRRAIVAPEDAHQEIVLERRLRPVHPGIDARALGRVGGPQSAAIVAGGQVPENGVGLPHRQIAILDHRYASMGVQRPKRRLVEPAEVAAGRDVLMGQTEFADEPKHFLHIEGVAASPNLEHRRFLLMADAATPLRFLAGPAGFDGYNNAVERSRRRQLSNPVGTFLFSLRSFMPDASAIVSISAAKSSCRYSSGWGVRVAAPKCLCSTSRVAAVTGMGTSHSRPSARPRSRSLRRSSGVKVVVQSRLTSAGDL